MKFNDLVSLVLEGDFDPSVIQIVSKNGEFVMASKTPENVEV